MVLITAFLLMTLGKWITCAPQDLSGKMFTFAQGIDAAVKITAPNLQLGAATVCVRFFTDLTRTYGLFALATPSRRAGFFLIANKNRNINDVEFGVSGVSNTFNGQSFKLNAWQSVCGTWNANTGLTQFWLNGKPGCRKFATTSQLTGTSIIILGQEQDYGYVYNKMSFVGMMSDLHMWDYVLTPDQIKRYSYKLHFPNGNILNWAALEFQVNGRVLIEDEQKLEFQ